MFFIFSEHKEEFNEASFLHAEPFQVIRVPESQLVKVSLTSFSSFSYEAVVGAKT